MSQSCVSVTGAAALAAASVGIAMVSGDPECDPLAAADAACYSAKAAGRGRVCVAAA